MAKLYFMTSLCLCTWLWLIVGLNAATVGHEAFNMVHELGGDVEEITIKQNLDLQIFCRKADKKMPMYFFRSATLRIFSGAEDVKLIKGCDPETVYKQYRSSTWLFWIANLLPWRMRDASFPTFNSSCVGISTNQPYTAKLVVRYMDPWKVTIFCCGLVLYFMSSKLAKSATFFYSSATFVGALGAALLLVFLVSRVLPRGRGQYITMTVMYTTLIYLAGETWNRFEEMVQDYLPYVIVYISVGAGVSLISCYRFGPPTNVRTLNIIQWSLQISGLFLIYISSDLGEVSMSITIGVVLYNLSSEKLSYHIRKIRFKLFPLKRKLLTEEEFINQGAVETEKALDELRSFCNSPDCKSWKIVSRLKNPKRFSSFVEGDSHLNDEEILTYDSDHEAFEEAAAADLLTDDDDD